jgi:MFS family permease
MIAAFLYLSIISTLAGLLAALVFLGAGSSFYFVPTRAFLSDLFIVRRGQALGLQQASGAAGSAIAGGVAVIALSYATWQASFFPVLFLMSVSAILLTLWSEEEYSISSVDLKTRKTAARVFRTPQIRAILLAYTSYMFCYQALVGFLPTFLQVEKSLTSTEANLAFSVFFIVAIVAGPGAGKLGDRVTHSWIASAALVVSTFGLGALLFTSSTVGITTAIIVLAVGSRSFPPVMQAYLMSVFSDDSKGGDFGAIKTVYTGIGSAGPAYIGIVAQQYDYSVAFLGLVPFLMIGTVTLLWMMVYG